MTEMSGAKAHCFEIMHRRSSYERLSAELTICSLSSTARVPLLHYGDLTIRLYRRDAINASLTRNTFLELEWRFNKLHMQGKAPHHQELTRLDPTAEDGVLSRAGAVTLSSPNGDVARCGVYHPIEFCDGLDSEDLLSFRALNE